MLADSVYNYTYKVLNTLAGLNLLPEYVQIGNETNINIIQPWGGIKGKQIKWNRNAILLNAGISAARAVQTEQNQYIKLILHVAGVDAGQKNWFADAISNGITDFDIMGFSYYPAWSSVSISGIGDLLKSYSDELGKSAMIVETAYAFTTEDADGWANILSGSASDYPDIFDEQHQLAVLLIIYSFLIFTEKSHELSLSIQTVLSLNPAR